MNEYEAARDVVKLAELMNGGEKQEVVSHPAYYNTGSIEVIDAITAWGYAEGFNRGNAIKYIARAGRKSKDTEIQDLEKAVQYLQFEIDRLKGAACE